MSDLPYNRKYQPTQPTVYRKPRTQMSIYQQNPQQHYIQPASESQSMTQSNEIRGSKNSSSEYEEYMRKNEEYQNKNINHDSELDSLKLQLRYTKLAEEYNQLADEFNQLSDENINLKETLERVQYENQEFKLKIQDLKNSVMKMQKTNEDNEADQDENDQSADQQFHQQLKKKDKQIKKLKLEIKELMTQSKHSSASNYQHISQQNMKLEQQVNQLKRSLLLQKQKYEKWLYEKDSIIRKINEQNQSHNSQILSKKNKTIDSLADDLKDLKRINEQFQGDLHRQKKKIKSLQTQIERLYEQNQKLERSFKDKHSIDSNKQVGSINSVNSPKSQAVVEQYKTIIQQYQLKYQRQQLELQKLNSLFSDKQHQALLKDNQVNKSKRQIQIKESEISQYLVRIKNLQQHKRQANTKILQMDEQNTKFRYQYEMKNEGYKVLNKAVEQLRQKNSEMNRQLEQKNKKLSLLQSQNSKVLDKLHINSSQRIYDNVNQKQQLFEQLADLRKSLQYQTNKSLQYQSMIKQLNANNSKLKQEIQALKSNGVSSPKSSSHNYQSTSSNNQLAKQKINNAVLTEQITNLRKKLDQKTQKFAQKEIQIKVQYEKRVKGLQQQLYRFTQLQNLKENDQNSKINKQDQSKDFCIQQIQLDLDINQNSQNDQNHQKQFNKVNFGKDLKLQNNNNSNTHSEQKSNPNVQPILGSKSSAQSQQSSPFQIKELKDKIQVMSLQNRSLNQHLQKINSQLEKANLRLKSFEAEKSLSIKQLQLQQQLINQKQKNAKNTKLLQKQIYDLKEQIDRLEQVSELLKIDKNENKQKVTQLKQKISENLNKIEELQVKCVNWQKKTKQLEQDNKNLQTIHEQINDKYRKGIDNFKKEVLEMNEQIAKQKANIEQKKHQMKKLQNEYTNKINVFEDQNLILASKVKKQQLQITKLQQLLEEAQKQQIQKVIITRTQLINYKQTEKRLQDLQQQVTILLKQKQKVMGEKLSIQAYYQEQISAVRNNFNIQRERILKKLTQIQQTKTDSEINLQKHKEMYQQKKTQMSKLEGAFEKLGRDHYNIKLELSESLSEMNSQLVRNKTLAKKCDQLSKQYDQMKEAYERLVVQKSKSIQDRSSQSSFKKQLQMTYKQIEKLNEVLMDKQKQIKYFLNQEVSHPVVDRMSQSTKPRQRFTTDYQGRRQQLQVQPQYEHSKYRVVNKSNLDQFRQCNSDYPIGRYHHEQSFGTNHQQKYPTNDDHKIRVYKKQENKLIGGFRPEYCTFAPEFYKI